MDLLDRANQLGPRLIEIRRELHQYPELSFQEHRTAALAAREAAEAGFSVRTGIAKTGVVAELTNGPGPTVAIRADMDALPIQETNDAPYASRVAGVMHACGHDCHTAGLIGVAKLLSEMDASGSLPAGSVRLLFQPSEERADSEGKSGAMRMVEEGAMEGVDAVIGLHVGAHLPTRCVYLKEGPFFAGSDEIRISVRGRSAHAGRPQDGVDALALACLGVVTAQQIVSRRLSPNDQGVITFGSIQGGSAPNIIADEVVIRGTLRYFDAQVRLRIQEGVRQAFASLESMGAKSEVRFLAGYPPVVNDSRITSWVREAVGGIIDEGLVEGGPNLEAEDFAFFANSAPGAFFWLGAGLPEPRAHHRSDFEVDEGVLPLGAAILAESAAHIMRLLQG